MTRSSSSAVDDARQDAARQMTRRSTSVRCVASCALLALIAGCASTPRESFYTLTAEAIASAATGAPAATQAPATGSTAAGVFADAVINVDAAGIPESVNRPQLVISAGDNRVDVLEQQRWAEPLTMQVARVVALNLSRLLGAPRATSSLTGRGGADSYRVTLDFQLFESRTGESVSIDAGWTVRGPGGTSTKSGRSTVREPAAGAGYDALVAAHSRAIAQVSRDIAAGLQALPRVAATR